MSPEPPSPARSAPAPFRSARERLYWLVALGAVLLTWTTLYWARTVSDWVRDRGWITPLMIGLFVGAALAVIAAVLRSRPGWRELAVLGAFGLVYFFSIRPLMGRPEEALHFLQYGVVGGCFYAALAERRRLRRPTDPPPRLSRRPAVTAFLLTAAAGWADEGIQYVLPNRYYDLRDVGFNAAAAALAIAATAALRWARRRSARRGPGVLDDGVEVRRRVLGGDEANVRIADDFDAPLPEDLQRRFEGEDRAR